MKLCFETKLPKAFWGYDIPNPLARVEADLERLDARHRQLVLDRLQGDDVLQLEASPFHLGQVRQTSERIAACEPTLASLLEAVEENQTEVEESLSHLTPSEDAELQTA